MIQQFTVVSPGTRIFKTVISNIEVFLPTTNDDQSHVFLKGNFDNFRTWVTPTCDKVARESSFDDYDMSFMYETDGRLAEMLLFKFFRLTVYCHDWNEKKNDKFLGEAQCDLNTLACGPEDVTLTVYDGDAEVGYIHMNILFREEAEVKVKIPELIWDLGSNTNLSEHDVVMAVTKKGGGENQERLAPVSDVILPPVPGRFKWSVEQNQHWREMPQWSVHHFGVSVTRFLEECGFELSLQKTGVLGNTEIGHAGILFSAFMTGGDLLDSITIPCGNAEKDRVFVMDPKTGDKIGELRGRITFEGLPKYVQMYAGKNINGKIFNGKTLSGSHPMPLYVAEGGVQKANLV